MADSAQDPRVASLIERLSLQRHPEGGWFRQVHRSQVTIPRAALPAGYDGDRCAVTSILYLLPSGAASRWHRVRSEEIWLHHQGDDLRLMMGPTRKAGGLREVTLGQDASTGALLQAVVPPAWWQTAEALPGPCGYALVACIVAPGFEYADYELTGPGQAG